MSVVARNIFKGMMSGGLGVVAALLIQVVTVPLFISSWGMQLYADWLVVAALPMLLSVSDLGVINTLGNRAAFAYSRGRTAVAARYLSTGFVVLLPLASVLLVAVYSFIVIAVQNSVIENLDWVVLMLLGHAFFSLQCTFLASGFRAVRQFHIGSYGVNLSRLAEFFVICVVLWLGDGAVVLAAGLLAVRVVSFMVLWVLLRKRIVIRGQAASWQLLQLTLKDSLCYFLIPVSQLGLSQSLVFLVGTKFDAVAVVFFNSSRVLCRLILLASNMLAGAWRQEMTRFYALADRASFFALFKKLILLNGLGVVASAIFLSFFAGEIFSLWLGEASFFKLELFILILLSVSFSAFAVPFQSVLISLNEHASYALKIFIAVFISVCVLFFMESYQIFLLGVFVVEAVLAFLALIQLRGVNLFK